MDPSLAEIAASLTMDEIPVKLRCAACSKLASNAFRTPCCDQAICEDCQSSLPQACPVCLHEPVKADDCRPNKPLRATIKAFLKRKLVDQKKLSTDKGAAQSSSSAIPQALDPSAVVGSQKPPQVDTGTDQNQSARELSRLPTGLDEARASSDRHGVPTEAQRDVPQPSIETSNDAVQQGSLQGHRQESTVSEKMDSVEKISEQLPHQQQQQQDSNNQEMMNQWAIANGMSQGLSGNGMGFDGLSGGFPSMGFSGTPDMSQMMQFMPNNTMGVYPNMMAGMPGMGMDPVQAMSQGMYGGFGGPGIGMNGMNMGMGFPTGQGMFGGFTGQPGAWNSGQDNFNQNAYGGHASGMGGDFGANSGYAGYNMPQHQGNYNQMNHHQFPNHDFQNGYHGQNFHSRGRGRGRGYYNATRGRGGFNQVNAGNQANNEPFHHQMPSQLAAQDSSQSQQPQQIQQAGRQLDIEASPKAQEQSSDAAKASEERFNKDLAPGDADDDLEASATAAPGEGPTKINENAQDHVKGEGSESIRPVPEQEAIEAEVEEKKTIASETVVSGELSQRSFQGSDHRGGPRNDSQIVAAGGPTSIIPPSSPRRPQITTATPTLEQGYEHTPRGRGGMRGMYRGGTDSRATGRGRGGVVLLNGHTNHISSINSSSQVPNNPPTEPKGLGVEGAPTGPKAMREGFPNNGLRGGRGFSIIGRASAAAQPRTRGRSRSRSRSLSRSRSPTHHHSHHHRSHRHRSPSASDSSSRERRRERHRRRSRKYEDEDDEIQGSREPLDTSSKRSSHRSRRERDEDRDEERGGHRSHRSRRERSRERDREHRSSRKRSRSVHEANAADDVDESKVPNERHQDKYYEDDLPTRKRRDRDGDDERRDRKRSRRDHVEEVEDKESYSRSKHGRHSENGPSSNHDRSRQDKEKLNEAAELSKPDIDPHELERQARNKERLQKELQRREAMEGKGPSGKRRDSKMDGGAGGLGRRVSYKYEDEESNEATASRVEREREAGRWG